MESLQTFDGRTRSCRSITFEAFMSSQTEPLSHDDIIDLEMCVHRCFVHCFNISIQDWVFRLLCLEDLVALLLLE